jgi:hypothetical protein
MEHKLKGGLADPEIAKEIAMDHLAEFPDYYTRLDKMEKEAEKDLEEVVGKILKGVPVKEAIQD